MGKQVRKQKKSSIVAGGFFRFALYLIIAIAVIYIGKSAYDFGYDIFYQQPMDSEEEGRDITVVVEGKLWRTEDLSVMRKCLWFRRSFLITAASSRRELIYSIPV